MFVWRSCFDLFLQIMVSGTYFEARVVLGGRTSGLYPKTSFDSWKVFPCGNCLVRL